MAGETHVVWKVFYWLVVACGIAIVLASYLPGVGANSPQPEITYPTSGSVHDITSGSLLTLTCQVTPTLQEEGFLYLWWCNSTVDQSCLTDGVVSSPLWAAAESQAVTETVSTPLSLTLEKQNAKAEDSGQYFCVSWMEGSTEPPSSANITVNVIDPVQTTARGSTTTTSRTTTEPMAPPVSEKMAQISVKSSPAVNSTTSSTPIPSGSSNSTAIIVTVVILLLVVIVLAVVIIWFWKFRRQTCCKGHRVRQGSKNESFTSDGGINGFGMSPMQGEMQPFIMRHRCDIFIHHHGTDLTLAEMMRSKLLDQESHLHITLWSEIAGTGRDSRPSTKRLALSLVHSTTVVLLVSWKYLQHESQRFRLALGRIPRKVDSVRGKVIIVRRIEEDKVPQDLKMDIAHSLEYNVDTDSKFFWPRFSRAVVPQRDDMLYWRT